MMDYLGRGMDANAHTLPFFTRFDAKMTSAIAKLIGQGDEWLLIELRFIKFNLTSRAYQLLLLNYDLSNSS